MRNKKDRLMEIFFGLVLAVAYWCNGITVVGQLHKVYLKEIGIKHPDVSDLIERIYHASYDQDFYHNLLAFSLAALSLIYAYSGSRSKTFKVIVIVLAVLFCVFVPGLRRLT